MVSIRNITNKFCSDITIVKVELNCRHHQNQWGQCFFKSCFVCMGFHFLIPIRNAKSLLLKMF